MPRGRRPQPPRTDPSEIQRNRDKTVEEFHERTVNSYPPDRSPQLPTDPVERVAAMKAEAVKVTDIRPEDLQKLPEGHPARRLAVALAVKLDRPHGLDFSRALTAEQIKFLASEDTCPAAMMAKAMPRRPTWADQAFAESIPRINEKLCKGQMTDEAIVAATKRFIDEQLCKDQSVIEAALAGAVGPFMETILRWAQDSTESVCFCCGETTAVLTERSARGLQAIYAHAAAVAKMWGRFAVSATPAEHGDLFLRVVVPTYNAVNFDSRRCVDCGKVFALRTLKEREESQRCEDCSARFYSRESQRRRRAAPDTETRVRSGERGDAAIAAAERRQAKGAHWRQAEALERLIDEQEKDRKSTMTVKGTKKERKKSR